MTDARIRVLLIEDNPTDVRLIRLALDEVGAERFEVEWSDRLFSCNRYLASSAVWASLRRI